MPLSGKSFSVDTSQVDRVLTRVRKAKEQIDKSTLAKVKAATNIVYKTASARRPMMSAKEMKASGRKRRVSDPGATAGVPVQTGALQMSIKQSVTQKGDKTTGMVTTNSPYAAFMEFGTRYIQARPFMRPALLLNQEFIKALFAKKPSK